MLSTIARIFIVMLPRSIEVSLFIAANRAAAAAKYKEVCARAASELRKLRAASRDFLADKRMLHVHAQPLGLHCRTIFRA
ncbi:hypothetical protein FZI19_10805 [Cronobacter muytjensii]|uniref:Uncharacterized protein n=1 Tax=Cronobacter muytjensii TaxID=413501 RepID=A0A2T7ARV7_9ENTR|nr:hypothetical protein FZI19_10805 [Cronobacter muytjensii]PUX13268.1 hypothetical protein AUN14_12995 [Cronobacter muytjensii]